MTHLTEREALKPCPFCGAQPRLSDEIISPRGKAAGERGSWDIECTECWAYYRGESREGAIAAWNRRAPVKEAKPVAWRVKDFADGWILCHSEKQAKHEAESAGNLIQPLYAGPPSPLSAAVHQPSYNAGYAQGAFDEAQALPAAAVEGEMATAWVALPRSVIDVIAAARNMPRRTPLPGGCGTVHTFNIEAGTVWALDRSLDEFDKDSAVYGSAPPADPATAALDEEEAKYGAWKGDFAEALTMTGCTDLADLIDMANVGKSLMERIDQLTKAEGPFKNWTPADDPGEIVFDLANALDDALSDPPADPVRAALVEALDDELIGLKLRINIAIDQIEREGHGWPAEIVRAALEAETSAPVVTEGNHAS